MTTTASLRATAAIVSAVALRRPAWTARWRISWTPGSSIGDRPELMASTTWGLASQAMTRPPRSAKTQASGRPIFPAPIRAMFMSEVR